MKLKDWRKAQDLDQAELGKLLNLSQSSLSRIEKEKQWPDRQTMEMILAVTEGAVTPNDFVPEAQSESAGEAAE